MMRLYKWDTIHKNTFHQQMTMWVGHVQVLQLSCDWLYDFHLTYTSLRNISWWVILIELISLQVRYLHDFAERLELNVQFQNEITEITRDQNGTGIFQLRNQNGTSYPCRVVIIRFGIFNTSQYASFILEDPKWQMPNFSSQSLSFCWSNFVISYKPAITWHLFIYSTGLWVPNIPWELSGIEHAVVSYGIG